MATWRELSLDNLESAKALAGEGRVRSSVSRSYYAAYCALTEALISRGVRFARGWNNPAREQLAALISHNLPHSQNTRRRLAKLARLLRSAREDADYRPGISIDRPLMLNCIRDAIAVLQDLGVIESGPAD